MSDIYNPSKHGYLLDKLRHTDPKSAKKFSQGGQFGRVKQFENIVGTPLEEKMASVIEDKKFHRTPGTARQLNVSMSEALYNRFARHQGKMSRAKFLGALLDRYEQPVGSANNIVVAPQPPEISALLGEWATKLGIATHAATLRRLIEMAEKSESRAAKILELDRALLSAQQELHETKKQARLLAMPLVDPVSTKPPTDEVLFDFVNAFTGAQATADASGEILVTLSPAQMSSLFPIWGRAVKALGIAKGTK